MTTSNSMPASPAAKVAMGLHQSARGGQTDSGDVLIWVPDYLAEDLKRATGEVSYLLFHAASVFRMLSTMTGAGFAPEEGELCALYNLCARALKHAAEDEGDALDRFDVLLRDILKSPEAKEKEE